MDYYSIGFVCIIGLLACEVISLKKRIRKLEKRLNYLAKSAGYEDLSSDWISLELKQQAIQLKRDGKKVQAIKKIREQTQMDLIEAKRYVDKLD